MKKRMLLLGALWVTVSLVLTAFAVMGCPPPPAKTTKTVDLVATSQLIDVGDITVEVVQDGEDADVTVTVDMDDDYWIAELHIHVADSLDDIPQTKSGNPKPGNFEFGQSYDPWVQGEEYEDTVEDFEVGVDSLYIAVHAVVMMPDDGTASIECIPPPPVTYGSETAWGEGPRFNDKNWAMYFDP